MSGRHPDLTKYNDDFLVQAFQIQYPAPTSTDDARCMQNAYTVLRGRSELKDVDYFDFPTISLILNVSEPIATASWDRVNDFHSYITVFGDHVGWGFLDNLMGDPKKCGALYCDIGVRNARVARGYMTTLATLNPRLQVVKSELPYG